MENRESSYRFEEAETHCTVALLPELNKAPWGEIDNLGTMLVDGMRNFAETSGKKSPAYLIDLSALNYMGSAMVALVVRLWKLVKEKNGKMAVVNGDATVLEVLRLSGLEGVWTIVATPDEGLKSLGVSIRKSVPAPATGDGAPGAPTMVAAESPGATGWTIAAVVLLLVSAAGLFFLTSQASPLKDKQIALGLLFGAGVLGLIPATVAACFGIGLQRTTGIASVLGCLALLVTGVVVHPNRDAVLVRAKPTPSGNVSGSDNRTPAKTNSQKTSAKTNAATKTNAAKTAKTHAGAKTAARTTP